MIESTLKKVDSNLGVKSLEIVKWHSVHEIKLLAICVLFNFLMAQNLQCILM